MVHICVICMAKDPPLQSLFGEARKLLEAVVSPVVNLHPLSHSVLLACEDCLRLVETVLLFQKTAIVGVKHLLSLPTYKQLAGYFVPPSGRPVKIAPATCPPLQNLSAPTTVGPTSNVPPPLLFKIVGPPRGTPAGTWTPVQNLSAPPAVGPTSSLPPPPLHKTLLIDSTGAGERRAPGPREPGSEGEVDGDSGDPLLGPIKTEQEVPLQVDYIKVEIDSETLKQQLTHEVDIKLEPEADSATDSAGSDLEDSIPLSAVLNKRADDPAQDQLTPELATPSDEPLITTFTHTRRVARIYSGQPVPAAPRSVASNIDEALRTLPKLPKLLPRPEPAVARPSPSPAPRPPPPGAMSRLTRRPAISQLESSVAAMMEGQSPSFSRGVARVAGAAPTSAAPAGPAAGPADQQSASQSWFVRVLPDAEVAAERAAAAAAPEFLAARHKCLACLVVFQCETGKTLHDKTHHPFADGRYECRVCGHRARAPGAAREHERAHATRYVCSYCAHAAADAAAIRQHYCEPKLRQWEKTNFVKDLFGVNKKARQSAPLTERCAVCYARFADADKLERHQARMHSKPEEPQTCKICNKQVRNKTRLYHHLYLHKRQEQRSLQPELRAELYCAPCRRAFDSPSAYRTHQLSLKHDGRDHWQHECDDCGRTFPSKSRVRQHIQIVHLKQMNYPCAQCPVRCNTASRLRAHERSHGPPVRPHVCHLCGKSYTIKKSLKEHLLAHEGLRPLACALCPATFTYSAALFTHNRLKHLKVKMTWKKRPRKTDVKEGAPTNTNGEKKRGARTVTKGNKKGGAPTNTTKKEEKEPTGDQCVK